MSISNLKSTFGLAQDTSNEELIRVTLGARPYETRNALRNLQ